MQDCKNIKIKENLKTLISIADTYKILCYLAVFIASFFLSQTSFSSTFTADKIPIGTLIQTLLVILFGVWATLLVAGIFRLEYMKKDSKIILYCLGKRWQIYYYILFVVVFLSIPLFLFLELLDSIFVSVAIIFSSVLFLFPTLCDNLGKPENKVGELGVRDYIVRFSTEVTLVVLLIFLAIPMSKFLNFLNLDFLGLDIRFVFTASTLSLLFFLIRFAFNPIRDLIVTTSDEAHNGVSNTTSVTIEIPLATAQELKNKLEKAIGEKEGGQQHS